ncbi:MAG TPA: hypothetical protein PKD51_12600 [Saprospiraceae bacterium]|nr:hypothetical protein [Saprospiraceae bacterium]
MSRKNNKNPKSSPIGTIYLIINPWINLFCSQIYQISQILCSPWSKVCNFRTAILTVS